MKHPNIDYVQKLVRSLMTMRKYEPWRIEKINFSYFPSAYDILFTDGKTPVTVKLVTELIDDVDASSDPFKKRKIKKLIKFALLHDSSDGD